MSFENPFFGIGKKIKNAAKIGGMMTLGAMPMASSAAENIHAGKEPQGTEADSAREIINSDTEAYMQGDKEYYYSHFPNLSHEIIDSLVSDANQKLAKNEVSQESGAEKSSVVLLTQDQKDVLSILYPAQVKDDPDFAGRWMPPSDELVKKYQKGEFKTKDDLIKLNQMNKK
jgi:hypothetical protein